MNAAVESRQGLLIDEPVRDEPAAQPLVQRAGPAARPIAPVGTDANALLAAITAAAANPKIDVAKVERLFAMHQTVVKQQAEAAFNEAMALTQAEIGPVIRDRENTHTHSWYATLAAIDERITPIHTRNGLSISYDMETKNDADPITEGCVRIVGIVMHKAGFSRRHHIDLPPDTAGSQGKTNKTPVQGIVSATTYGKRVLKMMVFNVSTRDDPTDDDGNSGDSGQQQGQAERAAPGQLPFFPDDNFLKNLPTWKQWLEAKTKSMADIKAIIGTRYRFSESQEKKLQAAAGVQ